MFLLKLRIKIAHIKKLNIFLICIIFNPIFYNINENEIYNDKKGEINK